MASLSSEDKERISGIKFVMGEISGLIVDWDLKSLYKLHKKHFMTFDIKWCKDLSKFGFIKLYQANFDGIYLRPDISGREGDARKLTKLYRPQFRKMYSGVTMIKGSKDDLLASKGDSGEHIYQKIKYKDLVKNIQKRSRKEKNCRMYSSIILPV